MLVKFTQQWIHLFMEKLIVQISSWEKTEFVSYDSYLSTRGRQTPVPLVSLGVLTHKRNFFQTPHALGITMVP